MSMSSRRPTARRRAQDARHCHYTTAKSAYPAGACDNAVMMISITTIPSDHNVEGGQLPDVGVERGARGSSRVAHQNRKCNWKRDRPVQSVSGVKGTSCSPVKGSAHASLLHASSALLCAVFHWGPRGRRSRGSGTEQPGIDPRYLGSILEEESH